MLPLFQSIAQTHTVPSMPMVPNIHHLFDWVCQVQSLLVTSDDITSGLPDAKTLSTGSWTDASPGYVMTSCNKLLIRVLTDITVMTVALAA